MNVPKVVEQSPMMMGEVLFLGNKVTTVYTIDAETGMVLDMISTSTMAATPTTTAAEMPTTTSYRTSSASSSKSTFESEVNPDVSAPLINDLEGVRVESEGVEGERQEKEDKKENGGRAARVINVARIDYVLQAVHYLSGEALFHVATSTISTIPVVTDKKNAASVLLGMREHHPERAYEKKGRRGESLARGRLLRSPSGEVMWVNRETGESEWSIQMPAAATGAFLVPTTSYHKPSSSSSSFTSSSSSTHSLDGYSEIYPIPMETCLIVRDAIGEDTIVADSRNNIAAPVLLNDVDVSVVMVSEVGKEDEDGVLVLLSENGIIDNRLYLEIEKEGEDQDRDDYKERLSEGSKRSDQQPAGTVFIAGESGSHYAVPTDGVVLRYSNGTIIPSLASLSQEELHGLRAQVIINTM